jgi:hypothetical protein
LGVPREANQYTWFSILMKSFSNILNEAEDGQGKAHREAVAKGLKYRGFGYWEDPYTGEVKFKTDKETDTLVPVEPEPEAGLGTPGGEQGADDRGRRPDRPGAGGLSGARGLDTDDQMMQSSGAMPTPPPVGSQVLGAPEPGEEQAFTTLEWEPGPDGSTCVNSDDPPADVPEDAYVNRTNNLKWGAGPDGSNYSNIDYADLLKDMKSPNLDNFMNRMKTQQLMGKLKEGMTYVNQFFEAAPAAAGMGTRSAADEAAAAGLTHSGYGYWKDGSGQVVARTVDGKLQYIDQGGNTPATTDMGNPTSQASGQTPADKARSMGLVSDGSGSYKDEEGNTIARTVNNELVFYDSRAGGGAVSDGSGGAQLTQSAPSWVDPVTGVLVVPPAQPESPEEINAVPDATPATAPAGYDAFVNKKKKEAYQQQYTQNEVQQAMEPEPELSLEGFMTEARRKAAPIKTTVDPSIAAKYAADQAAKTAASKPNPTVVQTQPEQPSRRFAGTVDSNVKTTSPGSVNRDKPLAPQTGGVAPIGDGKNSTPAAGPGSEPPAPRGGVSTPGQQDLQPRPEAPALQKLDVDGDGDIDREDVAKILGDLRSNIGDPSRRQTNATRGILERLDHPVAGKRIKDFLGTMLDEDKNVRQRHKTLSTFNDKDGALRFLTEAMGLEMKDGKLSMGAPNRERRALGGAGMPGEGRGEPRGIGFRELQALKDPTRKKLLEDAQYDESGAGARAIHKLALKNDIPWEMANELYDMMDPSLQGKLNGWGKPEAAQGTFNPLGPVEFMKGADGSFTGETNIDVLARTDPEEYQRHFNNEAGGRNRGIFGLQKHLAQGGVGEFTGLANYFDFDTMTPDHIMGRSSGALPNDRAKDDPLNQAYDRRGLNQFKVSSQADGERDTLHSLVEAADKVKGVDGKVGYDEEEFANMADSPNFMNYLSYRLNQKDFDPATIAKRGGETGLDRYPESIEDFEALDDDTIKSLVTASAKNNPLGLNMRNMSMRAPRGEDTPLVQNTWGGAPGGGLEYHPLQGYRRAMLANALFDPEMKRQLSEHEETLRANPRMTDARLEKEMSKKRRDLVAHNHFGPQKAIASLYGLGQTSNEQYVERLRELAMNKLGFMQESNPEAYERMTGGLNDTLNEYRDKLDQQFPNNPFQVPPDQISRNMSAPYVSSIMGSNYGRSMMPPELVEAFDTLPTSRGGRGPMVEDLDLEGTKSFTDFRKDGTIQE